MSDVLGRPGFWIRGLGPAMMWAVPHVAGFPFRGAGGRRILPAGFGGFRVGWIGTTITGQVCPSAKRSLSPRPQQPGTETQRSGMACGPPGRDTPAALARGPSIVFSVLGLRDPVAYGGTIVVFVCCDLDIHRCFRSRPSTVITLAGPPCETAQENSPPYGDHSKCSMPSGRPKSITEGGIMG